MPRPARASGFAGRPARIARAGSGRAREAATGQAVARVAGPAVGACGSLHPAKGRLFASCGAGSLELIELQLEGKRRMSAADFLNGHQVGENEVLEMCQ